MMEKFNEAVKKLKEKLYKESYLLKGNEEINSKFSPRVEKTKIIITIK